ncbi:hypothetical protein TD95_003421 [Thielaviopsis punctulata]|uniref:Mannosyl-oligosaccharide glucosidase n=1 Tax=Thielaviopsis punctulata TaxID=72032 RepID=A0A0F4Z7X4_9PEZI|nr:hypothetical protein TD95_003421 [Thielaviopsis punctulata]
MLSWTAGFLLVSSSAIQGSLAASVSEQIDALNNQSLFWGPYKPNLYFGARPRTPKSLWTGLQWVNVNEYRPLSQGYRYTCEQHDSISGYGWDEYDVRDGGSQIIHDDANEIDITTTFIKVPGGSHGGSWALRVKGVPYASARSDLATLVSFYIAQEDDGVLEVGSLGTFEGFADDVTLVGNSPSLGTYKMTITKGAGSAPKSDHDLSKLRHTDKISVRSLYLPEEVIWQGRNVAYKEISDAVKYVTENYEVETNPPPPFLSYLMENKPGAGNTHLVQRVFSGEFEFDLIFDSESAGRPITSDTIAETVAANKISYSERYNKLFNPQAPFNNADYVAFGKSMLSNLLGGIGYFYGDQMVDRSDAPEYKEENEGFWEETAEARNRHMEKPEGPYELFTSVPSRPFFPRGFLWDEGFHLIPVADWDMDLTLDIVRSWFKTIDDNGWIPREQILGAEPRSKVPEEFQVQYPHYANPPTLFLIVETFMNRLRAGGISKNSKPVTADTPLRNAYLEYPEAGLEFVKEVYPLLRRQYEWFRRTQKGDLESFERDGANTNEGYRWRGRTETHCLTSGLDDYPRAQPPHPGELHVDLMAWVGLMAKSLHSIADSLGLSEDAALYAGQLSDIQKNLATLHWSSNAGCFCDATIDDFDEHVLVCHKGYISLFPFLVGLMDAQDAKIGRLLDMMEDPEQLWSEHGLRSLSISDEFYGTAENYWRSPVWININYMAISRLYDLASVEGPHRGRAAELYGKLREAVVKTVYESWKETGFAWEQYDPETGKGQRTQHFTGWTSLVVKIMAMGQPGVEGVKGTHDEL